VATDCHAPPSPSWSAIASSTSRAEPSLAEWYHTSGVEALLIVGSEQRSHALVDVVGVGASERKEARARLSGEVVGMVGDVANAGPVAEAARAGAHR
jgi:hypothetical protein